MRLLGIAVVVLCIASLTCASISVPHGTGNRPAANAGAEPSPRGWHAALAAERGRRQGAAAHLTSGKAQLVAQTRGEGDAVSGKLPHQAAAEAPQQGCNQHLPGTILASFVAGAAVGYWLGRFGVPRQVHKLSNKPDPAGQHAHAPDGEAAWQKEHAAAKEELQVSTRAMAAAIEAEALKLPAESAEQVPTVPGGEGCGKASSPEGLEEAPMSAASAVGPVGNGGAQEQPAAPGNEEESAAEGPPRGRTVEEENSAEGVPSGTMGKEEGAGEHTPCAAAPGAPLERPTDAMDAGALISTPDETRRLHVATPDSWAVGRGDCTDEAAVCSTSGRGEGTLGTDGGRHSVMPWPWVAARTGSAGQAEQALELEQWDSAGALWEAFTRELKISPDALSGGERLQLASLMLQAWTTFQAQGQHAHTSRLRAEANAHHAAAAAAAQEASALKRSRFEHALRAEQLDAFHSAMGDGLVFGMVVMLASAGACAWHSGLTELLFGHCRRLSDLGPLSVYRPWAAAQYASVLGCWAGAASDVLVAAAVMLWAARLLVRSQAVERAHGAPLRKLALCLGAGCGAAGYFVMRRLGGDPLRWVLAWEAWVALHLLTAWCMPALLRTLSPAPLAAGRVPLTDAQEAEEEQQKLARLLQQIGLPLYHAVMAVAIPLAIGFAPFSARLSAVHAWQSMIASL